MRWCSSRKGNVVRLSRSMGPIERDILTSFPFCGTDATLIWMDYRLVRLFSNLTFHVGNTRRVSDSFAYVHSLFRMYLSHDTQQWGHFNVKIDTTSQKNRYELKTRFIEIECFNIATSVAYSDSFTSCHECRSYLNSITNDDRQIIVRMFFIWCLDIVLLAIG